MDFSIALSALGFLLAGVVKGATGLGYSSCALPFLVSALGLKVAIVVLVVPAMLSNVFVMFSTGHLRETVSRFWRLYVAMPPGIVIGLAALTLMDQGLATRSLGVITILYTALALARPSLHLAERLQRRLQVPVGMLNGFFTGLTGSQMMPLLPYMLALKLEPDRLVQANNVAVLLASACLMAGLMGAGIMTWTHFEVSVAALIPAFSGVQVGTWIRARIPQALFRTVVLTLLAVVGFVLVARS
jgi:uncharacterized membrane protein YfcA